MKNALINFSSYQKATKHFEDPVGSTFETPILNPAQWIRPTDLFSNNCTLLSHPDPMNLIPTNGFLCEASDKIRMILTEISLLFDLSLDQKFRVEGENIHFKSKTGESESWRPWHHIYSHCSKSPENPDSRPLNRIGKYYVRLYFMVGTRRHWASYQMYVQYFRKKMQLFFYFRMLGAVSLWTI